MRETNAVCIWNQHLLKAWEYHQQSWLTYRKKNDTYTKDDEEGDIWCEALESKTNKKEDLVEVLGEGRPNKDGVDTTYDCGNDYVLRNF